MRSTHSPAVSCSAPARTPFSRPGRTPGLLPRQLPQLLPQAPPKSPPLLAAGLLVALLAVTLAPLSARAAGAGPAVPVPGQVTMVDLGAKSCIPCKMMAPILAELEAEYRGRAAIVFLDVRENPDQVDKFGLRAIPTQIFYDRKGQEVWRHEGFLDKASIVARLKGLGADEGK